MIRCVINYVSGVILFVLGAKWHILIFGLCASICTRDASSSGVNVHLNSSFTRVYEVIYYSR